MPKARLVITAVFVEGRTVSEATRTYNVSQSWAYELVARYRNGGDRDDPQLATQRHELLSFRCAQTVRASAFVEVSFARSSRPVGSCR